MMQQKFQLEYFVLQYARNVARKEFINIGLVMFALGDVDFSEVRFLENWTPVLDFDSDADVDYLQTFAMDIREQIRCL